MSSLKNEIHDLVVKLKQLAKEMECTPTMRDFIHNGAKKKAIERCGGHLKLCKAAGLPPNKNTKQRADIEIIVRPPRILMFDIETLPILAFTWQLWKTTIPVDFIVEDWSMLSYAAKFLGEDHIEYLDIRKGKGPRDEKKIVEAIHRLLIKTDVLVAHNLMRFDWKKVNAKFLEYDLPPLDHLVFVDTWLIACRLFNLSSNKLQFLAEYLKCEHRKGGHKKFAGVEMWTECYKMNQEAFIECEEYNRLDVIVLEEIYHKLIKYDPKVNFQSFYYGTVCTCGHKKFYKDGFKYTKHGKFQVFRCSACSKVFTSRENLIDKDIRKKFFK